MIKSNDILIFQIINWVGGFIWFSVFLRFDTNGAFGTVAGSELFFGFAGTYITSLSIRLQQNAALRRTEWHLMLLRMVCIIVVSIGSIINLYSWTYVFAIAAFACTPAHLPLLFGYRIHLLWPLILRLPLAALLYWAGGLGNNLVILSMCYFAPVTLYGVITYICYFRELSSGTDSARSVKINPLQQFPFIFQLVVTVLVCSTQAKIVQIMVLQLPLLALFERLLRSAYSFVFPHLIRNKILNNYGRNLVGRFIVAIIFLILVFSVIVNRSILLLVPVLGDIYTSLVAGHVWWLDMTLICILAVFTKFV